MTDSNFRVTIRQTDRQTPAFIKMLVASKYITTNLPYRSVTRLIPNTRHMLDYLHKKISSKY